jgi:protein SCO1
MRALIAICLLLSTSALVSTSALAAPAADPAAEDARARDYFTDHPVTDIDGKTYRFYSEVLADRTVLMNFFFTACKGICPMTSKKIAELQTELGDRLGKDIHIISIALDPKNDTPEVVRKYAQGYGPKTGWHWVTGDEAQLAEITKKLGETNENIEAHTGILIVGNVKSRRWQKMRPNLPAAAIAERLRTLADGGGKHNVAIR